MQQYQVFNSDETEKQSKGLEDNFIEIPLEIHKLRSNSKRPMLIFLFIVSAILIIRLFAFISRYAVNILYHDQWDFYTPLFHEHNVWKLFTWQHGPHRQGIGLIITGFLANASNWDSQIDAYAVGILMCIAYCVAIRIKIRLSGGLEIYDACIAFLFFTLFQYEIFTVTPNLSYAALPILMIMIYCLGYISNKNYLKYPLIICLNFLLIYTGFGLFMGPITILLIVLELCNVKREAAAATSIYTLLIALLLAVISLLSFFISYKFDPAIPNFSISASYILQYPLFIALMFATFFGWHASIVGQGVAIIMGLIILILMVAMWSYHCIKIIRKGINHDHISLVIVIMLSFSILFCLNTAVGRTPLGLNCAQANRYLPFLIPAFFAFYLHLITTNRTKLVKYVMICFVLSSMVGVLPIKIINNLGQNNCYEKNMWIDCYAKYENVDKCYELLHNEHFYTKEYPDIKDKLAILKERRLNLYHNLNK